MQHMDAVDIARLPEDPVGRRRAWVFWLGLTATVGGTVLHLPMYLMARDMGFRLAGMPMDGYMVSGMVLIVLGLALTTVGLFPRAAAHEKVAGLRVRALDDAPINRVHVLLLLVMAAAITIDVMKPTTLAFVVPGVGAEYHLRTPANPQLDALPVALLPLFGLTGTVAGSFLWGWLGDRIGRQAAILLAGVFFAGTAVCGAMPSFELNLAMCFIMGLSAGGMLPIAFTLLSEAIPARHRGWLLVLIGGDVAGAYIITSWLSSTIGETYSWRSLWLLGLPTGLLLVLLVRWIPESPRYLLATGRHREAERVLRTYNAEIVRADPAETTVDDQVGDRFTQLLRRPFAGVTLVLALLGLGVGLVTYGFQLWLPSNLRALGFTGVNADRILRDSALIGFPLNFLVAYCYHRSSKWTLVSLGALLAVALAGFVVLGDRVAGNSTLLYALLVVPIWGSSSIVAVIGAYGAEAYPTRIRSRGSGVAAALTKAGGVLVIALVVLAVATPSISVTALLGAVPVALAAIAAVVFLVETRRRSLEEITAQELQVAA
ncbi:putative MFS transporter [Nocardia transvalensis]|uniref:Putative MFS transporter n=1 Tax=Nocardia transvalensis TaxID=37333 RepID=A0A7W9PHV4_9NOCA|nr:MFS transporter [Nocardia transvalensis]MBB5916371.1 putative MFS transporter [Nocardia transvalensis]